MPAAKPLPGSIEEAIDDLGSFMGSTWTGFMWRRPFELGELCQNPRLCALFCFHCIGWRVSSQPIANRCI